MDSSINVGETDFDLLRNFIKAIGNKFIISETASHMSASVFGNQAELIFNMSRGTSQDDFTIAVDDIPYLGDARASLDKALELAYKKVFTLEGYSRQNVPKVLVVLTGSNPDGSQSARRLKEAALPLRKLGVKIIMIPIGVQQIDGLRAITSLPHNKFFMPQANFGSLLKSPIFIQQVSQMICTSRPGICGKIPDPDECAEVQTTCEFDVNCPTGEKCCLDGCKLTCEAPKAGNWFYSSVSY